jgi:hypothetical protein
MEASDGTDSPSRWELETPDRLALTKASDGKRD